MNQTKIEWCDATWNPVTGCLHGCPYCYARTMAHRFGNKFENCGNMPKVLDKPWASNGPCEDDWRINPYPYGFAPTFHRYRLEEPEREKKSKNIFVVSMGDLFGNWVPDDWIQEVFAACERAQWHRYLFLTKNPSRYGELEAEGILSRDENYWYGTTITNQEDSQRIAALPKNGNQFVSIEPIMGSIKFEYISSPLFRVGTVVDWIIIGAETGNRKEKVIPQRSWVEEIVKVCRAAGIPVFMKNSLASVWGTPLIQEFPWRAQDG